MKQFLLIFTIILATSFVSRTASAQPDLASENSKKLDLILLNQEKIKTDLEEIKKELYVVKIRATR